MTRAWLLAVALVAACAAEPDPTRQAASAGGSALDAEGSLEPVRWFAASSVGTVADALVGRFGEVSGRGVRVNLAATSVLAHQIVHGAPVDVWVSADREWVEHVADETGASVHAAPWATNRVVVVCGRVAGDAWPRMFRADERFAVGDPDHVPVGRYGRAWFRREGWWSDVEPHLVLAPHARATLAFVETGAADCGLVYETDARQSPNVRVIELAGASSPTTYWLVAFPSGPGGGAFAEFLHGAEARAILTGAGFGVPEGEGS